MKCFVVKENTGELVGVILANSVKEFNFKLKLACGDHFDEEVELPAIPLVFGQYRPTEVNIETDQCCNILIVEQTELY